MQQLYIARTKQCFVVNFSVVSDQIEKKRQEVGKKGKNVILKAKNVKMLFFIKNVKKYVKIFSHFFPSPSNI